MPYGIELVLRCFSQPELSGTISVHHKQLPVAFILLDAVIADAIQDLAAIRRNLDITQPSEGPQYFRGHDVGGELQVVFEDQWFYLALINRGLA